MREPVKLSENVFLLTVNDRSTHLFENLWPLENGVAYNSYLICDEKIALIDTVEKSRIDEYMESLESILKGKTIDYLVINHMEPDHSGGIKEIVKTFPDIKIIGNKMTFALLKGFYGEFKNNIIIADGEELDLGSRKLKFYITPWVHWPETMMTYDLTDKILFAGDAFGSYGTLDGGIFDDEINLDFYIDEMRRYYSNIVGKYSKMVQKALTKLADISPQIVAATHGPIWRTKIAEVLKMYNDWSSYKTERGVVIVYGSLYGNTEKMADVIARELAINGIKNIRVYNASKTHLSYILSEIWKYKGLFIGSSAYNAGVFPPINRLTHEIEHLEIKEHLLGIFGSSSWNGAGVKGLNKFAENIDWEIVHPSVEAKSSADIDVINQCKSMAKNMAARLKEIFD